MNGSCDDVDKESRDLLQQSISENHKKLYTRSDVNNVLPAVYAICSTYYIDMIYALYLTRC